MTRYGGMGRTRPKKLTSKASIPIVREDQIDVIDEEVQATLQQVETGVEKAEESVRVFPNHPWPDRPHAGKKSRDFKICAHIHDAILTKALQKQTN
jgi:hypothetical protein